MRYNRKYYIYTKNHNNGNMEVLQVNGTPTKIEILTACQYTTPKLFIHKVDDLFRLSDAATGLKIADFKRLKDLNSYISDDKNLERIFDAINTPQIKSHIYNFNQLIKEYAKA